MKKFLLGMIVGVTLTSTFAGAVSYMAHQASFKVLVNGEEFISDPPALVVEGRTYLPLRAVGDALGVVVRWNSELNQAEIESLNPSQESGERKLFYYKENPSVPDYGKIFGVMNKAGGSSDFGKDWRVYKYADTEITYNSVMEYCQILIDSGFISKDEGSSDNLIFINKSSKTGVSLSVKDGFFNILVLQV